MTEPVQLALIAVIASLLAGTIVVAVGVWADGRRKRSDAGVAAQAADQNELVKVRMEYLNRIEKLESRLDQKDSEIRTLTTNLGAANVVIAQQAARIADLEHDLAELHRDRRGPS